MSLHLWSLAVTQTSLLFARQYMANAAHHQEDSDLASLDVGHVIVQPSVCGVPIVCSVILICMLGYDWCNVCAPSVAKGLLPVSCGVLRRIQATKCTTEK